MAPKSNVTPAPQSLEELLEVDGVAEVMRDYANNGFKKTYADLKREVDPLLEDVGMEIKRNRFENYVKIFKLNPAQYGCAVPTRAPAAATTPAKGKKVTKPKALATVSKPETKVKRTSGRIATKKPPVDSPEPKRTAGRAEEVPAETMSDADPAPTATPPSPFIATTSSIADIQNALKASQLKKISLDVKKAEFDLDLHKRKGELELEAQKLELEAKKRDLELDLSIRKRKAEDEFNKKTPGGPKHRIKDEGEIKAEMVELD